jgi:hypothetical protein
MVSDKIKGEGDESKREERNGGMEERHEKGDLTLMRGRQGQSNYGRVVRYHRKAGSGRRLEISVLSQLRCVTIDGVWIDEFIDLLTTYGS